MGGDIGLQVNFITIAKVSIKYPRLVVCYLEVTANTLNNLPGNFWRLPAIDLGPFWRNYDVIFLIIIDGWTGGCDPSMHE